MSWTKPQIIQVQTEVRTLIKAREAQTPDKKDIYNFLFKNISELSSGSVHSNDAHLRCYVFIMSAIVMHMRRGGLKPARVNQLADLAYALLNANGIKPINNKLAFLYSDVHQALSQIHWRNGCLWKAAVHQVLTQ